MRNRAPTLVPTLPSQFDAPDELILLPGPLLPSIGAQTQHTRHLSHRDWKHLLRVSGLPFTFTGCERVLQLQDLADLCSTLREHCL